jgi:uncharacterized repeat protein (TIGR01451 family)
MRMFARGRLVVCVLIVALQATARMGGQGGVPSASEGGVSGLLPAVTRPSGMSVTEYSQLVGRLATQRTAGAAAAGAAATGAQGPIFAPSIGLPSNMSGSSPFSAAIATSVGGGFNQVSVLGDWDGKEDLVADHEGKIDDFSLKIPPGTQGFVLTRSAISAHTIANGFNENVFYYGDSLGNVYVAQSPTLGTSSPAAGLGGTNVFTLNLPTIMNAFGTLQSDDQVVVTGLCVSPVVDLSSFANVNGSFAPFNAQIGEILYVTFWDTGSGFRLAGGSTPIRSGVLAFPIADIASAAAAPPGIQSPLGFPVQVGGSFGVVYSTFSNLAGCAVDDDGSLYFHQADLQQKTGGNIVKMTRTGTNQDRSGATNGILTISTLNPASGNYGVASGPVAQVNTFTNYSGTSTMFGNIVALAAGSGNTLYAAVARSWNATDDAATQATEGPFTNPVALGATPSMIISFRDYKPPTGTPAALPVPDGFADVAAAGATLVPGVNNFRVFVAGNGPDLRAAAGSASPVLGTIADTLKLDMQIDYSVYSGLAVDEEDKVYVISGGSPAGLGTNPSPTRGEILLFTDDAPADRRADYVDFRGDVVPNPPASGGNVGDGDSDRYDHIFWQSPIDQISGTPAGVSGLTRGFLRYLNRTAPNAITNLPNGLTQGDDATTPGPVAFSAFDPGHQVDGGDDQNAPFTGDDTQTGGPVLTGGFEFTFGGNVASVCTTPWNGFFLNSNGNITFNAGDITNVPSAAQMLTGAPRIAGTWGDLNPASRAGGFLNTFPLQAIGFANVNHFKVRWINVPEFGLEGASSRNTFAISLYDDGLGQDENSGLGQIEGPTDLRFSVTPGTGTLLGRNPRLNGTGNVALSYGRMDIKGLVAEPVVVGYSSGGLPAASVAEINIGEAGRSAAIGHYTETAVFELFDAGDFDLRSEGSGADVDTSTGQPNLNRERIDLLGKPCSLPFPSITGTKTVTGSFAVGGTLTYTVVLKNNGTVAQPNNTGPEYIDTLPANVALVGATATSGVVTANAATNMLTWDGALAGGASVTITYQAVVASGGGAGPVKNQGTILTDYLLTGVNRVTDVTDDPGTVAARDATATAPMPLSYFLAEGATSAFFHTDLLLANPNAVAAPVAITYLRFGDVPVVQNLVLPATSRTTISINDVAGMAGAEFSTRVDSTSALPLIVERTMRWDATGYGAHTEKATTVVAKRWLFAEGSQGFFSTYVLLANTTAVNANVTLTFLTEASGPIVKNVTVAPNSRLTYDVSSAPDLVGQSFSIVVDSDVPIASERSMYFGTPLFNGGTGAAGVNAPSTHWQLAEGATGSFFDMFVLVGNPNPSPTTVTFTYLLSDGTTVVKNKSIAANARLTVNVEGEDPLLASVPVSVSVTATQPVIVERTMYWPGGPSTWYEAHASAGVTDPGLKWGLAEGRVGGPENYQTYILLGNSGASTAHVSVTYLKTDGTTVVKSYTVLPTSRFNISVNGDVPELANESFGAVITSDQPIFVERSLYSDAAGVTWAAGTNATASPLP